MRLLVFIGVVFRTHHSMLMIVEHPNGNPKDMKNMVGVLTADIG